MNLLHHFSEIGINPRHLTEKKQQTNKKIEYVKEYMRQWSYVMLERDSISTVNFIDCMCNAGVYRDGDCCTVIEVLQVFLDLAPRYPEKRFNIWCSDIDSKKIEILKKVVAVLPKNPQVHVYSLVADVNDCLDALSKDTRASRKIFAYGNASVLYVDPFDFGTVEIPKISAVLRKRYCELLFNFFSSDYVRNVDADDGRLAKCLGGNSFKTKEELIAYLRDQFRVGHIKYLFAYQFRTLKNVELYQIVFATPNQRGLEKLKDALWYVFNGAEFHRNQVETGQMSFFTEKDEEDLALCTYASEAKSMLCDKFAGQTVAWREIELYLVEHTMLKESQILAHVLKPLIECGKVIKQNSSGKRNYKDDSYSFSSAGDIL